MSTTDDTTSTSTPDATALDPAMLDEVEQALDAVQNGGGQNGGGQTDDGGIPIAEGQPVAKADTADGGVAHPNGGIPIAETTRPGGGVARPNGGIPHAEIVRP